MNRQDLELPLKRVPLFFGLSCRRIGRDHDIPKGQFAQGLSPARKRQDVRGIVMFQVALVVLMDDRVTDEQKINFSAYPQDGGDLLEKPSQPGGRPPRAVLIEYIYHRPLPNH